MTVRLIGLLGLLTALSGCANTEYDDWCADTKYGRGYTAKVCLDDEEIFRLRYRF